MKKEAYGKTRLIFIVIRRNEIKSRFELGQVALETRLFVIKHNQH